MDSAATSSYGRGRKQRPLEFAALPDWELRVVQTDEGRWTVLDGNGYGGCFHDYETQAEAAAWLEGYESGTRDNA